MTRRLSALAAMMNNPAEQIKDIFREANLLRAAEHITPDDSPSPEYLDALHTLQGLPDTNYMVVDGREQLAVPITSAADVIADQYERRDI